MAGFLGRAPITSDVGLFLEIGVTVAIIIGRFIFARRGKIVAHGALMAAATTLHASSVLLIMVPSLAKSLNLILSEFFNPAILVTLIHAPLGASVIIVTIWLISKWRFRHAVDSCYKRTKIMRRIWLIWVISLILGYSVYLSIAIFG